MPVRIPDDLPAARQLEEENIFVMRRSRAVHQDIRVLRIAVLNLMPTKETTETQILRVLGNSPVQIDVRFIHMATHEARNTSSEHLDQFYESLDDVLSDRFDGLVITGAPVESLPFEDVDYWPELQRVLDWSSTNVWSTLHICWGAQVGLWHHYGVPKYPLAEKMFGLFHHNSLDLRNPLLRGFDESFLAPHSRHTEVRLEDVKKVPSLEVLAVSEAAGVYIAATKDLRRIFVTGHPEYDRLTLKAEYDRDVAKGLPIAKPANYFPADDPSRPPLMTWRAHAHLLYANWLNYCVYEETPYDLSGLPR